jgi:hypothetical protein
MWRDVQAGRIDGFGSGEGALRALAGRVAKGRIERALSQFWVAFRRGSYWGGAERRAQYPGL